MNILCNNYELICNISKYLIEPAILISNHYYTFDNKLKFIKDKKFSQDQINNYLYYIKNKLNNINSQLDPFELFLNIINDINNLNLFWRCNGHTVYFDEVYIQKNWMKTITYNINPNSFYKYKQNFYNFIQINKLNYQNNMNKIIQQLKRKIILYENAIKIKELQFRMKWWNVYFQDYLLLINNDLNLFKVSSLIHFIRSEELIFNNINL